jgi:radical SAM superfamily enzyme YgiQ (UPF0313 family)
MKILFFHHNDYLSNGIPGGIAALSAILKQRGHRVDIFDTTFIKTEEQLESTAGKQGIYLPTDYTLEDLAKNDPVQNIEEAFREKLNSFGPDLIAVSVMTGYYDEVIKILENVKPEAKILVGGVHSTISPEDALRPEIVDFICIGEGEEFLMELCDHLERKKDYTGLLNLGYKKDGKMFFNEPRPFIDLDKLPVPDWSIFDERHLFRPFMGKIYKGSFYVMSRGCPMRCSYCVNISLSDKLKNCGKYFRFQTAATTVFQLKSLKETYGATWFKFADDSLTYMSEEYLEELAEGLKPLNIQFGCSIRPESVNANKIKLLKAMGCVAASVGVESGSMALRKKVLNRHMTDKQIEDAVRILKEAGIRVSTFNMIGLPGETREDVFKTINFNKKLNADAANVYIIYPYPGTPISENFKVNFRDREGNLIPVSKASYFRLSEMPPEEVEGLLKTFNLYLKLPEDMWSEIKKAEAKNEEADNLFKILREYSLKIK